MVMRSLPSRPWKPFAISCAAALAVGLSVGEAAAGFKLKFGSSSSSSTSADAAAKEPSVVKETPREDLSSTSSVPAPEEKASAQMPAAPKAPVEPVVIAPRMDPPSRPEQTTVPPATVPATVSKQPAQERAASPVLRDIVPAAPVVPGGIAGATAPAPATPVPAPVPLPQAAAPTPVTPAAVAPMVSAPSVATVPAAAAVSAPAVATPVAPVAPAQAANPFKSGAPSSVTQTSYSKSRKRFTSDENQANGATLPAHANAQDGGGLSVVTCMAGCGKAPGEVIHQQVIVVSPKPNPVRAASSAGGVYGEATSSNVVTCVAGCYDARKHYQAVPAPGFGSASGQVMAGAAGQSAGQMVPTAGAVKSRGASGDWMARINSERAKAN